MIVAEFIERLTDRCGGDFALIAGAAQLSSVADRPPVSPAAYVVPMSEESGESEYATGPVSQRSEIDIAVVIIVDNVADDTGASAAMDIEPLKRAVRKALLGYTPPSAADVVTHVSGTLTSARGGTVWWEEVFATAAYLEEDNT